MLFGKIHQYPNLGDIVWQNQVLHLPNNIDLGPAAGDPLTKL
jgi:hypothetical protein